MKRTVDVAIVGAGPYGLSISAYLSAWGIEHRIFGTPMQTWRSMPDRMFLKSLDFATSVYSPKSGFSFIEYCRDRGISSAEPIPMELFSTYGLWAQEQLAPHLEQTEITSLSQTNGTFDLQIAGGERFESRRVVMAIGLTYFAYLPETLRGLPRELVSHTSHRRSYEQFRGRDVAVVGSGQSALEAAVMLHEAGARAQLITRRPDAYFANHTDDSRPVWERLKAPMSVLGAGRLNFFLQWVPFAVHYMPDKSRIQLTRTHLGPFGAWWLAPRFQGKVPVLPRTTVVSAEPRGDKIDLKLRAENGTTRTLAVDHVVAGTGYEPDLSRVPFLDPALAARIGRIERAPRLTANFESSVRDLYFVGAASALSHGPLFRFVCGADYAAPVVARHLRSRSSGLTNAAAWVYTTAAGIAKRSMSPQAAATNRTSLP